MRALLNRKPSRSVFRNQRLRVESLEERAVPAAPVIEAITDRTLDSNRSVIQVPVVAADADDDQLAFTAKAAGTDAFFTATDLQLKSSTRPTNRGGSHEKRFTGKDGSYFLLANGDLFRWDKTPKLAVGTRIIGLDPVYYYSSLLTSPSAQSMAYQLDQRLGLATITTPAQNTLGLNERWLSGTGDVRFIIEPDGSFFRVGGTPVGKTRTFLTKLDPVYYQNPGLLAHAQPRPLDVSVAGNVVRIDGSAAAGEYAVQVRATDGKASSSSMFNVTVAGTAAPIMDDVDSQILGVGEQSLAIPVQATDVDGDTLTYSVKVSGTEASFLDSELQLTASTRPNNWGGEDEKWFRGQNGEQYFIIPSGEFYHWDGTPNQATGDLLSSLSPVYYYYPTFLTRPTDQPPARMDQTSLSLLQRFRGASDSDAWPTLLSVYVPLLEQWLRGHKMQPADIHDLIQEIVVVMLKELPAFEHNGRIGAFRHWPRQVMVNCLRSHWRSRWTARGDDTLRAIADQLEDPGSGLNGQWEREHDQFVLCRLTELIEPEFEPNTWQAFRRTVPVGESAATVAAELGMSPNAVLIAKSRVLRRLREERERFGV
jgi:RNA polymerase sigma-70 factor (ECF subfamily)